METNLNEPIDFNDIIESKKMECNNHELVFVKRLKSNGKPLLNKQCLQCGEHDSTAYKLNLVLDFNLLPEYSEEKREKNWILKKQQYELKRENEKTAWFENYNLYLQTNEWKEKRLKVLKRDNWTCQSCLEREANEVHHITYKHVFKEPCFDLISICYNCHDELTKLDRNED